MIFAAICSHIFSFKRCTWRFILCCSLSVFLYAPFTSAHDHAVSPLASSPAKAFNDSLGKMHIASITVSGNKRTKTYIILHEMSIKAGDSLSISALFEKIQQSQALIYNTTLFSDVLVGPYFVTATDVNIQVVVREKWYIYPSPQFQLTDRSFNEWIKRYDADLDRVVYGVKFAHYNLSGRRDQLRLYLLNGYTRNFAFAYSAPYSNKALNEGFSIGGGFSQSRELLYATSTLNEPLRYKTQGFVRNSFNLHASYLRRQGFYRRHFFNIGFLYQQVDDSIRLKYNSAYFNNKKDHAGTPDLGYTFSYVNTNNINYPLTGKLYNITLLKRGLGFTGGMNMLSLGASYNRYFSHGRNWYSAVQTQVLFKLPGTLSYVNQQAFGYGLYALRGLENYVIDAVHSGLAAYTLKKKIVSFKIRIPIQNKVVPYLPFTFYAKTFADLGYAYNKAPYDTKLNNKLLYSGGVGIDVLTLYDINLRIEYSFNQLGQKGLFLHTKGGF